MIELECRVCGGKSHKFRDEQFLKKHTVALYQCGTCKFIQTEKPYWLEEAYSEALVKKDTGLVVRSIRSAYWVSAIIKNFLNKNASFIDYGAGYGLFVRLMRDNGYKFLWADKYANNQMAKGAEADLSEKYELLTAFEVAEHLENPQIDWAEWKKLGKNIFISTLLYQGETPPESSWWYYAQHSGQHIAIYHKQTMIYLAKKLNMHYYGNNTFHLFTEQALSPLKVKLLFFLLNRNAIPAKWFSNGSLTQQDSESF